ncbi:MAG: aminopeptidase P family protein [Candidatus Koribacter versatilis]|uniref:Aminopeptidase P family protein n=1 Tax=Candidatus Korobacter versatilis TaxID=658062 RepID=A0A932A881_9BACT|nr:aminopeptidase P family protein [Candidatus Koribacter versatilis]
MRSTRRGFLKGVGIAAGVALAQPAALAGDATPCKPLPEPIARLKSRKSEAKPITKEERAQRLERARELMRQNKLDAVFLTGGTSLQYFSGISWWLSERLFAMVLPAKGDAFFVCPAFEQDRAQEQIESGLGWKEPEMRLWQEDESPYALVAAGLKQRGLATATLGVEERVYWVYSEGVGKAAPAARLTSATPVTAGCRMIKSAHELELMTLANQVTLTAYEAAYRSLQPGMTRRDFAGFVEQAHARLGFEGGAGVQVGENSALPHGSVKPQVVKEGAILLVDGGCSVEGYQSDISRTFVLGKPTEKMKQVFDVVHRAQSAALAAAKPGVACETVDAAARKIIREAGFGPDYNHFTHRVGHGIGMDGHEWPYLVRAKNVRGDKPALAPGMCFSDEPGIYIRGEFGVRLEDDMHITENGAELFTPQSPSLEEPFGPSTFRTK